MDESQKTMKTILEALPEKNEKTDFQKIVEINRNSLCLIDISKIKNLDEMSDSEKRQYLAQAEAIYSNPVFQNELAILMQGQLELAIQLAQNYEQDLIARGSINGIGVVEERFNELHLKHKSIIPDPQEEEDSDSE